MADFNSSLCTVDDVDLNAYKCSDMGLLMPFVNEITWSIGVRATLYLLALLWSFLGVAIVADVFMGAIEKITSKTKTLQVASNDGENGVEEVEIKVWNDTVANLTLMALGSSAPEILLSCIEIVGNNFHAGELGPSTIVGSAAFNLLVITAVCVVSIPGPEIRAINSIKVFAITASFCVFAYVWLIIILIGNTAGFVDSWEAVVTFIFFPILVITAFIMDRNFCCNKKTADEDQNLELGFTNEPRWRKKGIYSVADAERKGLQGGNMNKTEMREFVKELKRVHPYLSEEDITKLATAKMQEEAHHSRMWYRINATRGIGGTARLQPNLKEDLNEIMEKVKEKSPYEDKDKEVVLGSTVDMSEGGVKSVIEFAAARSSILERDQRVTVTINRYGRSDNRVLFKVETIDGTAEANTDYVPVKKTMVFEKGETEQKLDIAIIDDNEWEPDEVFFVKINVDSDDPGSQNAIIGQKAIMEVTIVNDDEPGTFEFSKPSLLFKESAGKAHVPIIRSNGADGDVSVKWRTQDMCAKAGKDYEAGEGTLEFKHGETTKTLEIVIYDDQEMEKDENFKVEILEVSNGAKLGRIKKTVITIVNDDDFNGMVSRLVNMTNMNMHALEVDSMTYAEQFRNAMNVNGGDLESATHLDYIMHFLTFGWKIIFACIPPPSFCGGWLAFGVALALIGVLTAIVGDLASIFGCLIGLKPSVTAITFVALGTSLPDLFASKQSAVQEKYADNSIGNVTGSNSVNVFLGLGLPWLIASIYWEAQGKRFEVPAGSLGFSVIIYTACACVCIAMLMVRRYVGAFGAELGGPTGLKIATGIFFVLLWITYVLLSALEAYGHISVNI
eukprot:GHVU01213916.1.p1 GENE.GHVU01213916.1~~GHVU01213916.1.p1  ORF type:complete len:844 (+),score=116.55 GHVU01213916.1:178-2709(+)